LPDSDKDGLADRAEFVLGVDPANPDSDSDGILDGVEVRNGTNPLDGRPVATGTIASQPLPGSALDVCAFNNRAIVAVGDLGVSVLNVFNGLNPSLVAQVDTPGSAHQVACAGDLVAVADGAAGLAIIDIRDPANAHLLRQISFTQFGNAQTRSVAAAADLVFAGQHNGLIHVIEADTGFVLQQFELGGSVDSLAVEGLTLYALAGGQLWALPFDRRVLEKRGSISTAGGRLFVGNARAYVAGGRGFQVIDVSNPDVLTLLSTESTDQINWKQFVPNGSGSGLGVVGINRAEDNNDDIYLYDLRNGANTFVTRLETPGVAKAVSVFNGLGYLADGAAGLQVVNYLPYDANKQPPTGRIVLSSTNTVTAGGFVVVRAEAEDDVQVRNVQFFLDGELFVTDGNFPFEFVYRVPTNRIGAALSFSVRLADTGGNTTTVTNTAALRIVPDDQPPVVRLESPSAGQRFTVGDEVVVLVTAVDNVGIGAMEFRVDDQPVRAQRISGLEYVLLDLLPSGTHTVRVVAVDYSGFTAASELVEFQVWHEAISREYSVFNFGPEETPDAISREYSIFNFGPVEYSETISREYSVENKTE
jgi:hypothetical protein